MPKGPKERAEGVRDEILLLVDVRQEDQGAD
jgi:hypothetical protein